MSQNLDKTLFLAFKENVDSSNSDYQREYKAMIERLNSDKNAQFTLAPESVLRCVCMLWNPKHQRIIIESPFLQNYLEFCVEYYLVHGWIIF